MKHEQMVGNLEQVSSFHMTFIIRHHLENVWSKHRTHSHNPKNLSLTTHKELYMHIQIEPVDIYTCIYNLQTVYMFFMAV